MNTEFWIGLGKIHELTNNDEVDLIISVWNDIQTNITWRYPVFKIAGPTDKYRLTVGGGSGTGVDAIAYSGRHMFVIMMPAATIVAIYNKEDGGMLT